MDRRGRGASKDGTDYSLAREYEDVLAVISAADHPVFLLGHSFGGICALEAALHTDRVSKLILYEPPVAAPSNRNIAEYEKLIAEGNSEAVLERFLRENARLPDSEIQMLKQLPTWPTRITSAYTIPRELRLVQNYQLDPGRLGGLSVPTLLLLGGDSPGFQKSGTDQLHDLIRGSRVVILAGQQHSAMMTAPDMFVREIVAFLEE
jgi:pimeloyl-ACP methyl ester carboxylesterase